VKIDAKGRKRVTYKRYQTPLETLSLLEKPAQYLRDGLSMKALKRSEPPSATPMRHGECNKQKPNSLSGCG